MNDQNVMTKLAICIPAKSGIHPMTFASVNAMCLHARANGVMMALIQTDRSPVASARNDLARKALITGTDWALFVDSDMVMPHDAITRLLSRGKDVVGTFYCMRIPPYESTGVLLDQYAKPVGLQRAKQFGFGLVLMHIDVLRALSAPWFIHQWGVESAIAPDNLDGEISEDVYFCQRARHAGIELWADLDLSYDMGHVCDKVISVERPIA
jgi:hypothetical protein